ncbi:unnamed protein product [Closterium sp. Yama58-4]|nr:unnamed protein product [Closterium sp. Yama58-4]
MLTPAPHAAAPHAAMPHAAAPHAAAPHAAAPHAAAPHAAAPHAATPHAAAPHAAAPHAAAPHAAAPHAAAPHAAAPHAAAPHAAAPHAATPHDVTPYAACIQAIHMLLGDGIQGACSHPQAFVPSSAGPGDCIGSNFALTEAKVVLAHLLGLLKWDLSPTYVHMPSVGITLTPKYGMPLRMRLVE